MPKKLKILIQSRKTLFSVPGGDTIQVIKTKEYLEKNGLDVSISLESTPDLSGYDLIHVFNLTRPQDVYLQVYNAKKQGCKVALSTIFVDYSEFDRQGRQGLGKLLSNVLKPNQIEYLKVIARAFKNREVNKGTLYLLSYGYLRAQKYILRNVDVYLPNSHSEMNRVIKEFRIPQYSPYVVVPNGIDLEVYNTNKINISNNILSLKDCILCVGRIEGLKNQLNLVRAVKDIPYSLVLIGKPAPNHLSYFEQIKDEAGPNVHILGHIDQMDLLQYYKIAKVHALISWMETTGLSSLEAGAMGCNLVITNKGDTREYFGDHAFYCEPDSIDSIRQALIKAYDSPINPNLRKYILENFNWEKAAQKTIEGYEIALRS